MLSPVDESLFFDFAHFKLIISNIIKIVEFFLELKSPQLAQFIKSINLLCLVFLTREFLFVVFYLQETQ